MKSLNIQEIKMIGGGDGESDLEAIVQNATLALQVCGEGNVKSVTAEGFECFTTEDSGS